MKRGTLALLAALSMSALVAGGCASNETVKTEEPVKAATVAEQPKAEAPKAVEQPKAEEPKAEQPKAMEGTGAKASAAAAAFESVYFDFDKSDLRQDARDVLNKNAEALKAKADVKIKIEGNCDERGSAEYNIGLGDRRATAAKDFLAQLGVPGDRVKLVSYGKEKPQCTESNEECWQKNRRVHFVSGQ